MGDDVYALRVTRESARAENLVGRVLCHDLRTVDGQIALAKGRVLDTEDVALALSLAWAEAHLLALDAGDVHENDAGTRVARAAAGDGIDVREVSGGHWPLVASHRGLLEIDTSVLERVNALDGPCVYTLLDGQVVERGEIVARAKIIPFAVPEQVVADVEAMARPTGIVRVRPFAPQRVGSVVHEQMGERAVTRFRDAVTEKLAWFGSSLCALELTASSADAIVAALTRARDAGSVVLLVAGTKAMDVLDPTFAALDRVGARMVRHGVPAHPGSLLWLADWGGIPVVGMPTCGLFAQATVFDLVISRALAGARVDRLELARLGHGGFLTRAMAFRLPAYRATAERGAVE
ncbi:MAG: molybdopterin binding protein [Geminicoccaceae bacterium]|jgi:molybdopterin biosynthesis enzyme|nr:molybdopterin binding protein [Geminicoccaceae bacterium]